MSSIHFLFDEHIAAAVGRALRQRHRNIEVIHVGQSGGPPASTPDSELLCWIEDHDCMLVTNNRSTMPVHLQHHLETGRHIPGILVTSRRLSISELIDELFLIWGAALPDEFRDQIIYLPITK